jgi:methionyl-tRNA formyltransferase
VKVGYFADGPWAHKALEALLRISGLSIAFIVPRFDTQDPVLRDWSRRLSCEFLPCKNVNDPEFLEALTRFEADIFVSMSFNQILRRPIIDLAPLGFINCHAGKLPFYRGRNPLNWALINGETNFGITVHYVDEGIDTGDIIHQQIFPITPEDNYGSLLEKAYLGCPEVLVRAVEALIREESHPIPQNTIDPVGTYFGQRRLGDEGVDFSWTADRVCNFIRALSEPGPCARFSYQETEYGIKSATTVPGAHNVIGTVGEVIGRSCEGVFVKCGDSHFLMRDIFCVDSPASSFIACFPIGSRLSCMKASK